MARVVVVGGGLGGAASAVRLAKLGHTVTLVERLPRVGGAIGLVERDGYRWDAGPAATALPAVLRDLFRKSGRPLEREAELVPVSPLRRHVFADGTALDLPSGSRGAQLAAVDAALGAGLGRAWVHHVHAFAEPWDLLRRDVLERPWSPEHAAPGAARLLRSRTSLQAVAGRLPDPRLRSLATHHAVQGGHDPRRVPGWLGLVDYLEQNFGTWTFPGGFGTLAALLAKRLAERRVTVLTSTTATDVAMAATGPRAVLTDAGAVPAEAVVVAVDPHRLPALAPAVRRTSPAAPPAVTHLGLAGPAPDLPHEVVLHLPRGAAVTLRTAGGAPAGHAAWTVLARGVRQDVLAVLAGAGIDVRDRVAIRVDLTPGALVEQYAGSPYGVRWRGRATWRRRLGTRTPLPGVYAAGAATGGGGWVPFVGLSAALVAQEVGPAR